ncbi:carbohydrate ABC transporter permease [Virgisporangium aurantiacum]|uniref:ABC transporter permease n=1 Tax=Virgisporangium aurantiacum TaxID=175570 RepID=A0A8J4DY65_9ACTN|nr:carbohydrate ABC transporter permease [Virgisporangium aurantiacum]GIJ54579.1 ABC transporter permease [Virgisporangium aurantiacum]
MTITATRTAPPAAPSAKERRAPRRRAPWGAAATIAIIGVFTFAPVYWVAVTALTPTNEVFRFPPRWFPAHVTFDHFRSLWENPQLLRYLGNSLIVSTLTAVLTVIVSAYTAYSFAKFRYRGRRSLMYLVLASQMFPQALLLITLYLVFSQFGLLNTYLALILSFTTFTLPLCVWMLKGFFDTIPDELIEAAKVDGAGQGAIIHRILLPVSLPGLVATALFAFIRAWNDFIFALTLAGTEKQTLPPGLVNTFTGEAETAWPSLMAASLVVSLPVVIGFAVLQRYLVSGLTAGAVKG